ncbi:MAG: hypothetical protein ACTSQB_02005 [Candidatus Heimdallarchaeota archaeon]
MVNITIKEDDFILFKKFPVIARLVTGFSLIIGGVILQLVLPIGGIFPFEQQEVMWESFLIGLALIIIGLLLVYPSKLELSEKPVLSSEKSIWKDYTMKGLSNLFNLLNNREKKQKKRAAIFDLKKPKGRWLFLTTIVGIFLLYLSVLAIGGRFQVGSAYLFLIDIYLLIIPMWFVIRIEYWEHDILRKILFYYQFTQQDDLDELEFITTPAVELQRILDENIKDDEVMLPVNTRFMIDFEDEPANFDSLAIQIIINETMGNKFPSFVCFLRIRQPSDWRPLKKEIAYSDRIVKIQHIVEEDDLHLFVLAKSPKIENPNHTSPKQASKIFRRAHKMMMDFAE